VHLAWRIAAVLTFVTAAWDWSGSGGGNAPSNLLAARQHTLARVARSGARGAGAAVGAVRARSELRVGRRRPGRPRRRLRWRRLWQWQRRAAQRAVRL
jgi:hypothetical protein